MDFIIVYGVWLAVVVGHAGLGLWALQAVAGGQDGLCAWAGLAGWAWLACVQDWKWRRDMGAKLGNIECEHCLYWNGCEARILILIYHIKDLCL